MSQGIKSGEKGDYLAGPFQTSLFPRECIECGAPAEPTALGKGRPRAFCGDACRAAHHKAQKAAWAKRAPRVEPSTYSASVSGPASPQHKFLRDIGESFFLDQPA